MRILPAVDILDGRCVNLVQGDYAQETVFSEDPIAQAQTWWEGLRSGLIHIVDLDGAKQGRCCIEPQLRALKELGIPYEVGGGIRNMDTISTIISAGAERVILGTAAHREPALLREAAASYPGKIVVGIDAKQGKVALQGWLEVTETDAVGFARQCQDLGAARIIYTDILSDGMMSGPNLAATEAIARAVDIPVTASGGISSLDDLRNLRDLGAAGVDEAIIGRALYLGVFDVATAAAVAGGTG